jgi:hypothetical protein
MGARVVDRLARALEGKLDRRGFLARGALGGAALSVAPIDFALKPIDAYAAICLCNGFNCECGSQCCDGYTEFCCTLYGLNRCPPGTLVAGWWKVDASSFCGGGSRYYMDCNSGCGSCGCGSDGVCAGSCSGTICGCAFGNCGNRRAGCVLFRYGQCNQQVPCVGPIVCRLVSCIPPWEIDPTCTRTVAVDDSTRFHDAPCLHGGQGSIDVVALQRRTVRLQGWALDPNTSTALQIRVLVDGALVTSGVADRARNDLVSFFPGAGPNHGFDVTFNVTAGAHTIELYGLQTYPAGDIVRLATTVVSVGTPFGSFDVLATGAGGARVAGWMIDPNIDGSGSVHIYVDDKLTKIAPANIARADVAAAYPGFGAAHGFDTVVPMTTDVVHRVCVYAYNEGQPSNSPLLGCRTISIAALPFGALDVVERVPGGVRVAGWAIDPETTAPVNVHVYVDGALAVVRQADRERADINAAFPAFGSNRGFDITFAVGPGHHDVCVYAINVGPGGNPLIGCGSVTVNSLPFGALDVAEANGDAVRVAGWAIDPDTRDPIAVHVYVDGVLKGSTTANRTRTDVGKAQPLYGDAHGFDATFSAPGAGTVCVYSINAGIGSNALIACRAVRAS